MLEQKPSKLPLPLLLVLWILIKIGTLPVILLLAPFKALQYVRKNLTIPTYQNLPPAPKVIRQSYPTHHKKVLPLRPSFSLKLPKLPSFPLNVILAKARIQTPKIPGFRITSGMTMPKILKKDGRGRPRTQAFWPFYIKKSKRLLNQIFPKPIRWASLFLVMIGIVFFYSFILINVARSLPSPDMLTSIPQPKTTEIYDRSGKILYQIYEGQNRKLVTLDQIPQHLINATIAIEDKNFYSHPGVDFFGIARALKIDLTEEEIQGGSTITQQLIKNTLLTPDQTFSRKVREVLLAYWAERVFTKQQILQMYFNEISYGGTAWGIEAAAQAYFGKSANQLDLAESAYLAGLPAAPSDYSPFGATPQKGHERQATVLRRMVEDGYISQQEAAKVLEQELVFIPSRQTIKAPHFVMYIRSVLADKYGERTVSQGGLKVVTTLDMPVQQMAEEVVAKHIGQLANLKVGNGAAMVTEAKTGQILAMVGSKNYFDAKDGNFNVTLALRQPGSSIKPITYAAGFKQGFSPGSVLLDTPTTFKNPYGSSYSPVNYDGKFHGAVTVRTALGSSYNIPAVKMLANVGIPSMLQTARDLGITTLTDTENYGLSLTLGGGAVPMIQMMSAYNTFSQNGLKYPVTGIMTVTDSAGNVLEDNTKPEGEQVLPAGVAYLISHILSDSKAREPAFGPRSSLEIPGKTVAVKTGTSDDKRDNWTFGYTPEVVVGTWVGNNDNSPMDPALTSGVTGASQIWHDMMRALITNRPNLAFERPAGVVEATVDGRRDLVVSGQAQRSAVSVKESTSSALKDNITYSDSFSWGVLPQGR